MRTIDDFATFRGRRRSACFRLVQETEVSRPICTRPVVFARPSSYTVGGISTSQRVRRPPCRCDAPA